ncbi:hypothetical protein V2J09_011992 [Rumex salicifolius]
MGICSKTLGSCLNGQLYFIAASALPQAPTTDGPTTDGQVSEKSVFVNSEPIREDQVQNAIKFLSHPRVKGSPVIHRRNFLERKGLTKEEIDEAFRRVPDTPGVTSAQPTTSQDGQIATSSNIQQHSSPQTIQPVGVAPLGVGSVMRRQFHWYHAFIAVGFLAASGAGTIIIFKKTIVPRLRSWVRRVVFDDDEEDGLMKEDLKPSLKEEATAAAKAAAAAAAAAAKASQEMVIMKSEENEQFKQFMGLLSDQLQEIKSMKTAILKIEGQNHNSGRGYQDEEQYLNGSASHLRQPVANGRNDYDSQSVAPRSSSPMVSSEPRHPASYTEIMNMIQRGERPPNVRDINDAPPNPNQPISNPNLIPRTKPWETAQPARATTNFGSQDYSFPYQTTNEWQQRNVKITEIENEDGHQSNGSYSETPINPPPQRKWVPPQPPPVVMAEAAIAIRQPKSKPVKEAALDSTSSNASEMDELQKVTKISELGGEPEMNVEGMEIASSSEIQEEKVANFLKTI